MATGFTAYKSYTWDNSKTLWVDGTGATVSALVSSIGASHVKVNGTAKTDGFTLTAASVGSTLIGGSGNDTLNVTAVTNMWVNGGAGSDTIKLNQTGANVEFTGTFGSDAINVTADTVNLNLKSYKFADISFAGFTSTGTTSYTSSVLVGSYGDITLKSSTGATSAKNQVKFETSDKTFFAVSANESGPVTLTATSSSTTIEYVRQYGAGAATFQTAGQNDTLIGGTGNDTYKVDTANGAKVALFDGGDGTDAIQLTTVDATIDLTSSKFANVEQVLNTGAAKGTLRGLATSDTLQGGSSTDSIWSRGGADSISGGAGVDTFWFAAGDGMDTVSDLNTGATHDVLRFVGVNSTDITWSWGDTGLTAAYTSGGNDVVTLGTTNWSTAATVIATGDSKTFGLLVSSKDYTAASTATGSAGADYIRNFYTGDVVGSDIETLNGAGGADTLIGGSGKDSFVFDKNLAYVDGGAGADTLGASTTSALTIDLYNNAAKFVNIDVVATSNGADILRGYAKASETLYGGIGADQLWSAGGADSMNGGTGADTFWFAAGDGSDTVAATTDTSDKDVYKFTMGQAAITSISQDADDTSKLVFAYGASDNVVLQGYNNATIQQNASFQFTDVTFHLITDQPGTTLTGTNSADVMIGLGTNDLTFDGKGGKDSVYGGAGNDTIVYKSDLAYVSGGAGTDVLQVGDSVYTPATINLSDSKYVSIEKVVGGAGNDVLRGSASAETLIGGANNDALWGAAGNDVLNGGTGADTYWFTAGDGVDTIQNESTNNSDTVKFYAVAQNTDVVAAIADGNLNLTLTDGSKLVLESWESSTTKVNKFTFDNGTYSLSSDAKTWTKI